jgi:hypothetical protein
MYGLTADRKRVSPFAAPSDGVLVAVSVLLDGRGAGLGDRQSVRFVVYADRGGSPGLLLGTTSQVIVPRGAPASWIRIGLRSSVRLVAGTVYYLGVHSGPAEDVARYGNQLAVPGGMVQNDDSVADGPSRRFGVDIQRVDIGLAALGHFRVPAGSSSSTAAAARTNEVSIAGVPRVGGVLRAVSRSRSEDNTAPITHRWSRCAPSGTQCVPIRPGAGTTYRLKPADAGKRVRVEAFFAGGRPAVARSRFTAVIARARPAATPPSASGLANLWVHPRGGDCRRSPVPVAFAPERACGSLDAAYDAANRHSSASLVLVKGGAYSGQQITGSRSARSRIVFDEAPGESAVFEEIVQAGNGDTTSAGPDHLTLRNIETARFGPGAPNPENRYGLYVLAGSSDIRIENAIHGGFLIQGASKVSFVGGSFGPCRAARNLVQRCEINKVDFGLGLQSRDVLIDGVEFHGYDYNDECIEAEDCHWRSMYVNGVDGFTLRNSTFRDSIFSPWMTISGESAGGFGNSNILIENNQFGTAVSGRAGRYSSRGGLELAWCQNGSQPAYRNVTVRFNSFARGAGINLPGWYEAESSCRVTDFDVYGNIFGVRPSCTTSGVRWHHNVYVDHSARVCGYGDVVVRSRSMPFYAQDTPAPKPGSFALAGRHAAPDNRVPLAAGCPRRDAEGRTRGQGGFCDAGAFER